MTAGKAPIPQGNYLPAVRCGNVVYTSGMTPRKAGVLMFKGPVTTAQPLHSYQEAVELATSNALAAVQAVLTERDKIVRIVSLTVFIAAEAEFTAHSQLADYASAYLQQQLGSAGIGSRTAIGVFSLPGQAPVEIQLIAAVAC